MATRKKAATTTKKKRSPRKVIAHDPLSMSDEKQEDEATIQSVNEQEMTEPEVMESEAIKDLSVSKKSGNSIDLGGSLVISEVEAYRSALLEALQGDSDIVIDGAEIEQIDGAGLQLLAAFALEAEKMHIAFKWCGASLVLCEASGQLGLAEVLRLNQICQAA